MRRPRRRRRRPVSLLALLLLLSVLADGFLPSPSLPHRTTTRAPSRCQHRARAPLVKEEAAGPAAAETETSGGEVEGAEADCPCSDLGTGTGLGQAGPLTERCAVGDVVVLLLPDADAEGRALALAVVDGDEAATLLCLQRNAEGSDGQWVRDWREEPRGGLRASAVLRVVLGGGAGREGEGEAGWRVVDLEGDLEEGTRAGLRRPVCVWRGDERA